ncbi:MAG: ABC transporter substrate-binding protein [Desulfobacterales bacterium]
MSGKYIVLYAIAFAVLVFPAFHAAAETCEMELSDNGGVRDCAGRKINEEKRFSRIISLYGAHTENLFSLGLEDEIIGVGRHPDYPPRAREKPGFSPQDGPEKFLAARPDLVLVRPMIDRGYEPLMKSLEKFGIKVISLQPGNVGEMKTYWRILGRLTGREDAALEMIEKFDKGVLQARMLAENIDEKKTVYFEAIHDRFKTFTPGSMPVFALECAGGINAARDVRQVRGTNIAEFGKERIMEKGPEIDVYLAQKGPMNNVDAADIANEPGYGVIKAVKEGEIHIVDEQIVSRPTLRLTEGIRTIGKILYPEIYKKSGQRNSKSN